MKALIVLRQNTAQWPSKMGSSGHPVMIPFCNKPLLEYLVDFMVLSRCDSIVINMETPDPRIEDYFGNGERFGICISYTAIEKGESIDEILDTNNIWTRCTSFPLVVFDGLFFVHYDKSLFDSDWIKSLDTGLLASCSSGNLLIAPKDSNLRNISSAKTDIPFSLSNLETLDDYFRITMEILDAEQDHYVLPGYKQTRQIVFGKNVKISRNVQITPPVILGNNIKLLDNVSVGPHAVVGNNVILDEQSEAKNSIILSSTYIGEGLHLSCKIVGGKRLISLPRGDMLEIEDKSLVSVLPEVSESPLENAGVRMGQFFKNIWQSLKHKLTGSPGQWAVQQVNGKDSHAEK